MQVGTYAHLKNFRKGLAHQLERCESELSAATASHNWQGEEEAKHRLQWIYEKYRRLDTLPHEMITDKPAWGCGRMQNYGSLDADAIRHLTRDEIGWNEQLIVQEGNDGASAIIRRGASREAASAAATAPTRGPPATPGAGEQKVARATVLLVLNTTHHPQANPASLSSKPDTDASRHAIPSACDCTPRALPPGCFPSRRRGLPPLHGLKQHTVETQQRGRTRPRTEPRSSRRQGLPTLHLRLPRHGEKRPRLQQQRVLQGVPWTPRLHGENDYCLSASCTRRPTQ